MAPPVASRPDSGGTLRSQVPPADEGVSDAALRGRGARVALGLGWAALLLPYLFELVAILRANHLGLVARIPDDAFYYTEIAARAGRLEGFTFDGIHTTNGFHPLWQLLLVPVVGLLGAGTDLALRGVLVLGLVCCLAAVLLVVRLVRRIAGAGPALLGGILATQFALSGWVNGMEGPTVLLVGAALATALAAADRVPTRRAVVLVGVLSAALVLARLDFAPVLALLAVALWLRWRSARRIGEWAIGVAVVGVPAALWWLVTWGHVLSTSATVKRDMMAQAYSTEFGGRLSWGYADFLGDVARGYAESLAVWSSVAERAYVVRHAPRFEDVIRVGCVALLVGLVLLGAVVALRRWLRRPRDPGVRWSPEAWAIGVALVALVVKAVLDVLVAPLWAADWYADPQRLAAGFAVGAAAWVGLRALARRSHGLAIACVVLLAVLLVPVNASSWRTAARSRHGDAWQDQLDLAADWILDEGPSGRYGARESGLLGYRLDGVVPVVNLDGLVNDYAFAALAGRDAPLVDRIATTGVDYFVGRVGVRTLRTLSACGDVLWTSPERVPYEDVLTPFNRAPVVVVDTRACLR